MRIAVVACALAACTPRGGVDSPVTAREGVTMAVYTSVGADDEETGYAVIDDRRTVEVVGREVVLERLAPEAELSSLVIEPLGGSKLVIGSCARQAVMPPAAPDPNDASIAPVQLEVAPVPRERPVPARYAYDEGEGQIVEETTKVIPLPPVASSALIRCTVTAGSGRHRVRLLYVAPGVQFRTQHDIAMSSREHATVTTRFALPTPILRMRADVTLFAGLPGGDEPPVEVSHDQINLDGSTALFGRAPLEVKARMRRIWQSAGAGEDEDNYLAQALREVRVWLELDTKLAPGITTVRLELPDEPGTPIELPAQSVERKPGSTRMPLWADTSLRSLHEKRQLRSFGDSEERERFTLSISNAGDVEREVWIENTLAKGREHTIESAWPIAPTVDRGVAKSKLAVPPSSVARLRYTVATAQ